MDAKPYSDAEIITMKGARVCGDGLNEIDLLPEQTVRSLLKEATISEGRFLATIAADRKRIEGLEKFKEATLSIGVEIVPICMGCGKENCDNCPAGVTYTVKNAMATKQAADIERLRDIELKARDVTGAFEMKMGFSVLIGPIGRLRQALDTKEE